MKHSDPGYAAMREWMRRPHFMDVSPEAFMGDICSEGIEDVEPIFLEIEERLANKRMLYRAAADEARKQKRRMAAR